jgi:hypothetical protein
MYASADVTAENPWAAMARMGLQLIRPPVPVPETNDSAQTKNVVV